MRGCLSAAWTMPWSQSCAELGQCRRDPGPESRIWPPRSPPPPPSTCPHQSWTQSTASTVLVLLIVLLTASPCCSQCTYSTGHSVGSVYPNGAGLTSTSRSEFVKSCCLQVGTMRCFKLAPICQVKTFHRWERGGLAHKLELGMLCCAVELQVDRSACTPGTTAITSSVLGLYSKLLDIATRSRSPTLVGLS